LTRRGRSCSAFFFLSDILFFDPMQFIAWPGFFSHIARVVSIIEKFFMVRIIKFSFDGSELPINGHVTLY
jgi:hypothetical protein